MQNKKYSLFIGRYQPFHAGHKALMEEVLKEGKPVCIALRNTGIDEKNPFTMEERKCFIMDALAEWFEKDMVKIIEIPDIEQVCYGRGVGYGINQIEMPKEIQEISATKIREKMRK